LEAKTMSPRETNLLWLRDLLEHLASCQKQLEWAEDGESITVLTDAMLRDLERCQRLCEAIQRPVRVGYVA
jgi:hypothetical protein